MGRLETALLRFSPRSAAGGDCSNSWREDCVFGTAEGAVDRGDRDGECGNPEREKLNCRVILSGAKDLCNPLKLHRSFASLRMTEPWLMTEHRHSSSNGRSGS